MIILMENMLHKKIKKAPEMNNENNDHINISKIQLKSVTKNTHVLLYSYFRNVIISSQKLLHFVSCFVIFSPHS